MIIRLVIAWVVTQPILRLNSHVAQGAKQEGGWRVLKFRGANTVAGLVALLTPLWSSPISAQAAENDSSAMPLIASASGPELTLKHSPTEIWQDQVGDGFKSGSHSISINSGAGCGVKILGTKEFHDFALVSISYGYMLGSVQGEGHWYKGNWELRGELWGGVQFAPSSEWLMGLTPHLRYNFATGTRLVPYIDAGAGLSATSIGAPDLAQTFEFNLQAAGGVHWFIRNDIALGLEVRFLHLSCAGMNTPNLGVNNVSGMLGVSWFF